MWSPAGLRVHTEDRERPRPQPRVPTSAWVWLAGVLRERRCLGEGQGAVLSVGCWWGGAWGLKPGTS